MGYNNPRGALKQYGQVATQAGVAVADPHRLIQMLLDGALEKIATAKGYMQRGEIAKKGNHITWAISIVDGLRVDDLYDYMERRLFQANLENSIELLDEVTGLLREIKGAWDAIPDEVRKSYGRDTEIHSTHSGLGVG